MCITGMLNAPFFLFFSYLFRFVVWHIFPIVVVALPLALIKCPVCFSIPSPFIFHTSFVVRYLSVSLWVCLFIVFIWHVLELRNKSILALAECCFIFVYFRSLSVGVDRIQSIEMFLRIRWLKCLSEWMRAIDWLGYFPSIFLVSSFGLNGQVGSCRRVSYDCPLHFLIHLSEYPWTLDTQHSPKNVYFRRFT